MRLSLQSDADVLDGARENRICYASESTGGIVLSIREVWIVMLDSVLGFEGATCIVKCAELDGNLGGC